jgi:hypothetical protein
MVNDLNELTGNNLSIDLIDLTAEYPRMSLLQPFFAILAQNDLRHFSSNSLYVDHRTTGICCISQLKPCHACLNALIYMGIMPLAVFTGDIGAIHL